MTTHPKQLPKPTFASYAILTHSPTPISKYHNLPQILPHPTLTLRSLHAPSGWLPVSTLVVQHTFLFRTTLITPSTIHYGSYAPQTTRNCWDNGEYKASMINFRTPAQAIAGETIPSITTNYPIGSWSEEFERCVVRQRWRFLKALIICKKCGSGNWTYVGREKPRCRKTWRPSLGVPLISFAYFKFTYGGQFHETGQSQVSWLVANMIHLHRLHSQIFGTQTLNNASAPSQLNYFQVCLFPPCLTSAVTSISINPSSHSKRLFCLLISGSITQPFPGPSLPLSVTPRSRPPSFPLLRGLSSRPVNLRQ